MKITKSDSEKKPRGALALVLFLVVLGFLFCRAFVPEYICFFNDAPLGMQNSAWSRIPQAFTGQWYDLNSLGVNAGAAVPSFVSLMKWVCSPVICTKFMIPISLWFLGFSAWFFCRRSGFGVMTSTLGGLAACLITSYFSNACWGSVPPIIAFGADFLALAALAKRDKVPFWITHALAGLAVGLNVMEAADVGALFSILIAAFVFYRSLVEDGSTVLARIARGVGKTFIVAACAFFIAAYSVSALIASSLTGIAGTQQDEQTKAAHYDFATEWSLPKQETLALIIPNLFGCSVITPGAANYRGGIGTDPSYERYFDSDKKGPLPQGFLRHTGRGIYLGTFVALIAFWAALQSLRKKDSVFTPAERKLVWFWFGVACVSLLLAYGRHLPFNLYYHTVYALPYFSTIRNPDKFLHILTFAVIILFAYGLHGLSRRYLDVPLASASGGRLKTWWTKASSFDKRWVVGNVAAILLSVAGWALYGGMRGHVQDHLVEMQQVQATAQGTLGKFSASDAHDFAVSQLDFSLRQIGWFMLLVVSGSGLLLLIFSGAFAGKRTKLAGILLGLILIGDFLHANLPYNNSFEKPYTGYWNYQEKYETGGKPEPIIDFLRTKSYEHRVAYLLPSPMPTPDGYRPFQELYGLEWTQQLFPYYDIQTLDIVQMPRTPEDLNAFNNAMRVGVKQDDQGRWMLDDKTFYRLGRLWELTSTRYLLGPAPLLPTINQQFDTVSNRFHIVQRFELGGRPGVDRPYQYSQVAAVPTNDPNATYALFEFTGALPRATLFSKWEVSTNDTATLEQLIAPSFDPAQTVLVSKPLPTSAKSAATNQSPAVEFVSYAPADVKLKASPAVTSVLLLNDKYDPGWKVWVDGKSAELLECNFLMRGVYLEPGQHEVEFKFRPNIHMLYVNLVAIGFGVCLLAYVGIASRKKPVE